MVKRSHSKMIYRFSGLRRAYDFEALLKRLGVPAMAKTSSDLGWHVVTDSRCLEHAARLSPFIYKVGGAQ
jgi:hypothetical protein